VAKIFLDRQFNVNRLTLAIVLSLLVGCTPASRTPDIPLQRTSPCSKSNETSRILLQRYSWLATTTEPFTVAERADKGLTATSPSGVTLVEDPAVCRSAVKAFNAAFAPDPATTTEVHVIRFGSIGYIVVDEFRTAGEWLYSAVFDPTFTKVLSRGRE
jgi:hypothetical protein